MSDRATRDIYDAQAQDYAKLTIHDPDRPEVHSFMAALKAGGRVLDLGCGPGQFAARMAQDGFDVEAWDASEQMIALASQHTGVTAVQNTFDALQDASGYDGIFANFSLLHARRAEVPRHIGQIARALNTGGVFHIGMKLGTGESRDAIGRHYCYFSEAELMEMLTANGLHLIHRAHGCDMGLSGEMADWVSLQARKSG